MDFVNSVIVCKSILKEKSMNYKVRAILAGIVIVLAGASLALLAYVASVSIARVL